MLPRSLWPLARHSESEPRRRWLARRGSGEPARWRPCQPPWEPACRGPNFTTQAGTYLPVLRRARAGGSESMRLQVASGHEPGVWARCKCASAEGE
jgi:hypothetical protein